VIRRRYSDFMQTWGQLRGEKTRTRRLRETVMLLAPYKLRVFGMFVSMTLAIVAGLAPPYLAKIAIDNGIVDQDYDTLKLVVILYVASAFLLWGATYVQAYLTSWIGQKALQDLRLMVFEHLQKQSTGFYSRRRTGVLVSRLTNDVEALDQLVTNGAMMLFQSVAMLIAMMVVMLLQNVTLALACFAVFPLVALASFVFRVISTEVYRETRERIGHVTGYLQETISGVSVVRAYGRERRHIDEFTELSTANRDANMRSVHLNAAYFPAIELLQAISMAVILMLGGWLAVEGHIEIGVLVLFAGYMQQFFDPIQQLSQLYTTYQAGMAALDKIFDLLAEEPDAVDLPGGETLPPIVGAVEFDDVWFSYSGEESEWALRGVSIDVEPGETIALVGSTGAGKSTFAKLIPRFYDPVRGSVRIDGHDLVTVDSRTIRSQLGYVPQEGYLFSGSVADNIEFGRPGASRAEIEDAARSVGAFDVIAALPDGFDTAVGERGSHLSAGQRQLVAFARAMIAAPRLLILDEATSSVDVETEMRIEAGLTRLLEGRTAVVIAHRLSTIVGASRIAVLEGGEIVELGSHEELVARGGRYEELFANWERNISQ
jgi:ATP-binding cassette subfamily B protein